VIPALWPSETPLAVIRPDRRVFWYMQALSLCAAVGAAGILDLMWRAGAESGGNKLQLLVASLGLVAPSVFGALRDLRQTWVLTDRRLILGPDAYLLLDHLAEVRRDRLGVRLVTGGEPPRIIRLPWLVNPASVADLIEHARVTRR